MTSPSSNRARILISLCVLLAVSLLDVSSAAARSSSSEFRTHVDEATRLYEAGDYEEAIKEMKAAYAIRQLPRLLLNIGSAYRKLGRSKEALSSYEDYLRVEPNPKPEVKSELEAYIKQTRAMAEIAEGMNKPPDNKDPNQTGTTPPGDTAAGQTGSKPPVTTPPGAQLDGTGSPQKDQSADNKPVYKKWWFWTIIGGVVVGAAVTTGVVLGTRPKEPEGIEIRDNRF